MKVKNKNLCKQTYYVFFLLFKQTNIKNFVVFQYNISKIISNSTKTALQNNLRMKKKTSHYIWLKFFVTFITILEQLTKFNIGKFLTPFYSKHMKQFHKTLGKLDKMASEKSQDKTTNKVW